MCIRDSFYVFLTQRYNLGFKRDIPQAENDTTPAKQESVPVTSFIHTIQVERARHGFNSYDEVADGYYPGSYTHLMLTSPTVVSRKKFLKVPDALPVHWV